MMRRLILGHIVLDAEVQVNGVVRLDTDYLGEGFYILSLYLPEMKQGIAAKVAKTSY
jgi:hypothetical protein